MSVRIIFRELGNGLAEKMERAARTGRLDDIARARLELRILVNIAEGRLQLIEEVPHVGQTRRDPYRDD